VEPGRFVVGDAGLVLTRVIISKETIDRQGQPKTWLIVDAGSNLLIPIDHRS
jgi:diaminopimelate decarboxylase